jgi:putative transposase
MKQKQFPDEQIVAILQEAGNGETSIPALCQEKGITETPFYRGRNRFGGLQTKDVQRLKEREKKARLKRRLAERDREGDTRKEVLSKNW